MQQLDNPQLVPELLQLVAHVSTMRVVLRRWAGGDAAAASSITYPDRLLAAAQREFNRRGWGMPALCLLEIVQSCSTALSPTILHTAQITPF